jgi:predicted transcriptional regulator of viral defense system
MEGAPALSAAATYARLRSLGSSIITTAEATAALRISGSAASRALRTLEEHGLVRRLRYGLWSLDTAPIDPRRLAPEVTRPYPAYVSFESALSAHGMIDQLPRDVTLASLDRAKTVKTTLATFAVHHLPPELFGGFETRGGIPLATPEKALFDYYYVTHAHTRHRRRLPEVELPNGFSRRELRRWTNRIRSRRLRTQVAASLDRVVAHGGEPVSAGG